MLPEVQVSNKAIVKTLYLLKADGAFGKIFDRVAASGSDFINLPRDNVRLLT